MNKKIFIFNIVICLSVCFTLFGCSKIVEQNGILPSSENLQKLQIGVSSREEVKKIIGEPLIIDIQNGESWIYFGQTIEKIAFFEPKLSNRKVILISFGNKKLKNIEYFSIKDSKIFDINSKKVLSGGRKLTVLQQIFGNIGNFSAQRIEQY